MTDAADQLPPGHEVGPGGIVYMIDKRGCLVPSAQVKAPIRLQDDTTRSLLARADELAAQMLAFKAWAFETVDTYVGLLAEKYGAPPRGEKGNLSLFSFDGMERVTVQTADRLAFGPEIQIARDIVIGQLVPEWSVGSNVNLVALVQNAFRTDAEGQLSRYSILSLRQLECDDPRWANAMRAIEDSERVIASARYIRFYRRAGGRRDGGWEPVTLNLATA